MELKKLENVPPWEWPQGVGKLFLKALRKDEVKHADRVLATELAAHYLVISGEPGENEAIVDALFALVRDSETSETLRCKAAIALGPVLEQADIEGFDPIDEPSIGQEVFAGIQSGLYAVFADEAVPTLVRRRVLEASVRAPQDWHRDAIRAAYSSGDDEWKRTAVFSMRWVDGFDAEILEALGSASREVHHQAVRSAAEWQLDAAWGHVKDLVTNENTEKGLLLAAIDAVAGIRPQEAGFVLTELTESDDEDVVEAAEEAIEMAQAESGRDEDDDDDWDA